MKGGYLVCADFSDGASILDVDLTVTVSQNKEGGYKIQRAIIHKVNGLKRPGHLDHLDEDDLKAVSLD